MFEKVASFEGYTNSEKPLPGQTRHVEDYFQRDYLRLENNSNM